MGTRSDARIGGGKLTVVIRRCLATPIAPHPDSLYATTGSISYSTGNAIDGRDDLDGLNSPWIGREVVDRHCAEKAKRRVTTISHLDGVGCNRIVAACCQPCKSVTAIEIG